MRFVAVLAAAAALGVGAEARQEKKVRILFFTKSSGFEHGVIRQKGDAPTHAQKVLVELGEKHGFEVTHTKNGRVFTPENLAKYDAFFFYTSGDLTTPGRDKHPPMTPAGKAAFLKAIEDGKGFVGSHAASDTFHTAGDRFTNFGEKADPYVRMLGGEFIRHGKQQKSKMICADPKFPGMAAHKDGFVMHEEWYSFKELADDLHVLLVQETEGMARTGGDSVYNRPPYPATWARRHGKGRVFYTSMGHRADVWTNPVFQDIVVGGILWAAGVKEADVTPNLKTACPGYAVIPPKK